MIGRRSQPRSKILGQFPGGAKMLGGQQGQVLVGQSRQRGQDADTCRLAIEGRATVSGKGDRSDFDFRTPEGSCRGAWLGRPIGGTSW